MSITFVCAACPKTLKVPDRAAGRRGRCPGCGAVNVVPGPAAAPPEPEPEHDPDPATGRRDRWRRGWLVAAGACLALLVVGGVGYLTARTVAGLRAAREVPPAPFEWTWSTDLPPKYRTPGETFRLVRAEDAVITVVFKEPARQLGAFGSTADGFSRFKLHAPRPVVLRPFMVNSKTSGGSIDLSDVAVFFVAPQSDAFDRQLAFQDGDGPVVALSTARLRDK